LRHAVSVFGGLVDEAVCLKVACFDDGWASRGRVVSAFGANARLVASLFESNTILGAFGTSVFGAFNTRVKATAESSDVAVGGSVLCTSLYLVRASITRAWVTALVVGSQTLDRVTHL